MSDHESIADGARARHPSGRGQAGRRIRSVAPPATRSATGAPCPVHEPGAVVVIDCDACARQGTATCADCVVTFLCDRAAGDPVVVDIATERAVRLLGEVGLVPTLKHLSCVPPVADVGR